MAGRGEISTGKKALDENCGVAAAGKFEGERQRAPAPVELVVTVPGLEPRRRHDDVAQSLPEEGPAQLLDAELPLFHLLLGEDGADGLARLPFQLRRGGDKGDGQFAEPVVRLGGEFAVEDMAPGGVR